MDNYDKNTHDKAVRIIERAPSTLNDGEYSILESFIVNASSVLKLRTYGVVRLTGESILHLMPIEVALHKAGGRLFFVCDDKVYLFTTDLKGRTVGFPLSRSGVLSRCALLEIAKQLDNILRRRLRLSAIVGKVTAFLPKIEIKSW